VSTSALTDTKENKAKALSKIREHHSFKDAKSAHISQDPMAKLGKELKKNSKIRKNIQKPN